MRKFLLLSALFLGGCTFTVIEPAASWPSDTAELDEPNPADGESDAVDIDGSTDSDQPADTEESTIVEVAELVDAQDCAENEYWESHLNKCAFYPCCELKGDWTFVFNDMSTFPWKPVTFSAKITQNKAYVKLEITSNSALPLPATMSGTLEKSILHMDGENDSGFLTLDATDVKKQLEADEIEGDYVWLRNGAQMAGTFYLQRP